MASKTKYSIQLTHMGENDIALDTENYEAYVTKIKKSLTEINKALKDVKKRYKALEDDKKTKGKFKKSVGKIVDGSTKKINKNKAVKNSLESSILKSTTELNAALKKANKDLEDKASKIGDTGAGNNENNNNNNNQDNNNNNNNNQNNNQDNNNNNENNNQNQESFITPRGPVDDGSNGAGGNSGSGSGTGTGSGAGTTGGSTGGTANARKMGNASLNVLNSMLNKK